MNPFSIIARRPIDFTNPGIQCVTAQKQSPSAIDFLGAIKQAVALERRAATGNTSKALKDVVARCTAEYNRMVSKKSHRIDTPMRNLIVNMSFGVMVLPYNF